MPPRKIAPWLGLGFGLGLVLGLGGNFSRTQNIYNPIVVILWQLVDCIRHRLPKLVVWQSYHQWPKRLWDSFFHLFYFVDLTLLYHHYLQGEFFILCSHKELDFDVTQTYLLFLFIWLTFLVIFGFWFTFTNAKHGISMRRVLISKLYPPSVLNNVDVYFGYIYIKLPVVFLFKR